VRIIKKGRERGGRGSGRGGVWGRKMECVKDTHTPSDLEMKKICAKKKRAKKNKNGN
jgi:hypothetical protein